MPVKESTDFRESERCYCIHVYGILYLLFCVYIPDKVYYVYAVCDYFFDKINLVMLVALLG